MMIVTYLGHSGFCAETERAYYVFDYIRGELPPMNDEKPLYIFASHFHEDHFNPIIFEERVRDRATIYLLSKDILKRHKRRRPEWLAENEAKIQWISRNEDFQLSTADGTALTSTDEGVAFVLREKDGCSIYHAGDLNWWHWEGEDPGWNRNMETNYKREIDKLRGMELDAAFVPLDPRLEKAYCYGLNYFLEITCAKHIFPMHFWEKYEVIPQYLRQFPLKEHSKTVIHLIEKENESYEF